MAITNEQAAKILCCTADDLHAVSSEIGLVGEGWNASDLYAAKKALNAKNAPVVVCIDHEFTLEESSRRETCVNCGLTPYEVIERLQTDHKLMSENLSSVQARCSELLEETRAQRCELQVLRVELDEATAMKEAFGQKSYQLQQHVIELEGGGLLLPGWTCLACGVFTGTAKEQHTACRCCGTARPA